MSTKKRENKLLGTLFSRFSIYPGLFQQKTSESNLNQTFSRKLFKKSVLCRYAIEEMNKSKANMLCVPKVYVINIFH